MSTRRVLFVDGQPGEDNDLKKTQAQLTGDWDSRVVCTGREAQAALAETPFDIVVSQMALPDMSGTELLRDVSNRCPAATRFLILNPDTDKAAIHESWLYVHQYVSSPCRPESLVALLNDTLKLYDLLSDEGLRARIAAVGSLPGCPEIHNQLMQELKNENSSIRKLADLVSQDVSITAKVLATANSALFGLRNRVDNVVQAIITLGIDTVASIVFTAGVFSQFKNPKLTGFSLESIHSKGMTIGAKARLVAHAFGLDAMLTTDALLAGTLHDIGKLVMLTSFEDEFSQALQLAEKDSIPLHQAQHSILGVTDAAIGAYLLSLWGLRNSIVEAVAWHYTPSETSAPIITPLTAVHLAYATDWDHCHKIRDDKMSVVDVEYLTTLGIADQLSGIRGFCSGAATSAPAAV